MDEELGLFLRQIYQGVTPQTAEAFAGNKDMIARIVELSNATISTGPDAFFEVLTGVVEDWAREDMKAVICARYATEPESISDVVFQFCDNIHFLSVSVLEPIYRNYNERLLAVFNIPICTINQGIINDMVFRDPAVQSIISKSSLHKSKLFKARDSEMRAQSQRWKRGKNYMRDFFALVKGETTARSELRAMHTEMHSVLGYSCGGLLGECRLVPTNSPVKALVEKKFFDDSMSEKCTRHCCLNCCPCNDLLITSEEDSAKEINAVIGSYQKALATMLGYTQKRKTFFRERHLQIGSEWEEYTLPSSRMLECDVVNVSESINVNMSKTEEKKKKKKKKKKKSMNEEAQEISELAKKLKAFDESGFPCFEDVAKEESELMEFERLLSSMSVHEKRIKPMHEDSYLE